MKIKLFDSEWKLMELLWESEPIRAKDLSRMAFDRIGWNKNTTYTIIKKLIDKDAVLRTEPNFICTSILKKEDIRRTETDTLISKIYNGSRKALFSALLEDESLSRDEIDELKQMIEKR